MRYWRETRGALVLLLAALVVALGAVSAGAESLVVKRIDTPGVSPTLGPSSSGGLAVTPDGSVVRLLVYSSGIERIDTGGHATAAAISDTGLTSFGPLQGTLTVLADGSTAFLAQMFHGIDDPHKALGTLTPGSLRPRFVPLPASGPYTDWDATAIAPDGTVWRSLACRGVVSHTSRHGHERRVHLPRLGCDHDFRERYGAAFASATMGVPGSRACVRHASCTSRATAPVANGGCGGARTACAARMGSGSRIQRCSRRPTAGCGSPAGGSTGTDASSPITGRCRTRSPRTAPSGASRHKPSNDGLRADVCSDSRPL
jgi:hypothetical protein